MGEKTPEQGIYYFLELDSKKYTESNSAQQGTLSEWSHADAFFVRLSNDAAVYFPLRRLSLESAKFRLDPTMAGSQIERVFSVLESLTRDPRGVPMQALAEQLEIPKSATHRLLAELIRLGYVRQNPDNLRYQLSTKLVAMGFRYLASSGADIVQPVLDRLAQESGELVRLGVIEGERQTWIAKSQGARSGLRYDPDMGREAPLFYTASGHAWLACLSDAEALALVERQGAGVPDDLGPNAPRSNIELLERLRLAREQGYAWVEESSAVGTSAIAAVVRHPMDQRVVGVLSIAGPSARLPLARLHELAPLLLSFAAELSAASQASELFN
jgi:IclR family transcriptional regulator, acetate operon repressor